MTALEKFKEDVEELLKTMTPEELKAELESFGVKFETPKLLVRHDGYSTVEIRSNMKLPVESFGWEESEDEYAERNTEYPFDLNEP